MSLTSDLECRRATSWATGPRGRRRARQSMWVYRKKNSERSLEEHTRKHAHTKTEGKNMRWPNFLWWSHADNQSGPHAVSGNSYTCGISSVVSSTKRSSSPPPLPNNNRSYRRVWLLWSCLQHDTSPVYVRSITIKEERKRHPRSRKVPWRPEFSFFLLIVICASPSFVCPLQLISWRLSQVSRGTPISLSGDEF